MNSTSIRRMTENEAMFRKTNESVIGDMRDVHDRALDEGWDASAIDPDEATLLFYCECSNEDCRERIRQSVERYAAIHSDRQRFIVVPGHQVEAVENVVLETDDYYIVEKIEHAPEEPTTLHSTDL